MRISDWSSDVCSSDLTDTNLQIIRNDAAGAAVKTDLGASFPANTSSTDIYEITLASAVGASTMTYEVTNLTSGATTSGSFSTDVPAAGSLGLCGLWVATGATGGHQGDFFGMRSEEHTSELQSLMRISYAVFCLKKKKKQHY